MLVLSYPDGLRIDLHQLCQRILEPPRDGRRAPLPHVELGEFFTRQLARRVDRRAGLIDDHILYLLLRNLF